MIGIDTSAIIDLTNGDLNPEQFIFEEIVICDMVYFESLLGFSNRTLTEEYLAYFKRTTQSFAVAKRAADIFTTLKKQGKEIGQSDCWIAASYLENGVNKILTRNKKHFERIDGMTVISY